MVQKVLVKNSDHVKAGQVLIVLDSTSLNAELDKSIIQVISQTANKIRHYALLKNKTISTDELLLALNKEIKFPSADKKDINALLADRALLSQIQKKII